MKRFAEKRKQKAVISQVRKPVVKKPRIPTVLCEQCDEPIPPERLQVIQTTKCVPCLEKLERFGNGTVRHRMVFEVKGNEDVEEIHLHLQRGK